MPATLETLQSISTRLPPPQSPGTEPSHSATRLTLTIRSCRPNSDASKRLNKTEGIQLSRSPRQSTWECSRQLTAWLASVVLFFGPVIVIMLHQGAFTMIPKAFCHGNPGKTSRTMHTYKQLLMEAGRRME